MISLVARTQTEECSWHQAISWRSRKQSVEADSTLIAECIAKHTAAKDGLCHVEMAMGHESHGPLWLVGDNSSCDTLTRTGFSNKTTSYEKGIRLRAALLHDFKARGALENAWIPTKLNRANILTKALKTGSEYASEADLSGVRE